MILTAPPPARHRPVALLAGLICHLSFLAGISAMIVGLFSGMRIGRGPFTGQAAWVANALLVAQFPLLHSWLLSRRGGRFLAALGPGEAGRALSSTAFATIASLQILAAFLGWSPTSSSAWHPAGAFFVVSCVAYAASWLFLGLTMVDSGLALQTGALGWLALYRGVRPEYGPMPERGTFRLCRQPIYFAFALTLWTAPTWTWDRLAFAVGWTIYCVAGPVLKEARFALRFGEHFRDYQRRHPYFLPLGPR